jgi:anaphase-promoting complex subunit 8
LLFEQLEKKDEFSVENMEYYSNILYVKENHAKLSILAHKAHTTDKYREETCCIIGTATFASSPALTGDNT